MLHHQPMSTDLYIWCKDRGRNEHHHRLGGRGSWTWVFLLSDKLNEFLEAAPMLDSAEMTTFRGGGGPALGLFLIGFIFGEEGEGYDMMSD